MDFLLYQKRLAWARRRNIQSNQHQISNKYWHTVGNDKWCFSTNEGLTLEKHSKTSIKVFTKVQGTRSPDDGDWIYSSTPMGRSPEVSAKLATLLKRQQGKCNHCGLSFKPGDLIEIDHIEPLSKGGKNVYAKLKALHRHCHDTKTATDGSLGTHDIEPFDSGAG
ncbi:HNH endonuclease [Microseira sp. BLCC-F43]|uniref:HNH endonuclease n=1 Tax=Microseira sp. BLCC-F43 TaxID=3153602 RepID=UPI0035B854FE